MHAACAAAASRPPASTYLSSSALRLRLSDRLPARTSPRIAYAPLPSTRQWAQAFNQPLSFDTSKVTNMIMFGVRSARALTPNSLESRAFPVHAACATTASYPPAFRRAPRPASHALPFRLGSKRRPSTSR